MHIINFTVERINNMANGNYKFIGTIVLRGKIETLTGMHIGGSKEKLEIGGVDSPVLRNPLTDHPYIPGSSIKGKMRMLTEFALGKLKVENKQNKVSCGPWEDSDVNDVIGRVFGNAAKSAKGPTRIIVRDAQPDKETIKKWESLDSELYLTELKPENSIDRLTSEANPRFLERVIAGSFFNFEILYTIYEINSDEGKNDLDNFKTVIEAMRMLEHSGIGGSISRGYGQVRFHVCDPVFIKNEDYRTGTDTYNKSLTDFDQLKTTTLDQISPASIG